MVSTV
jgi:hypothetical protein